MKKREYRLSNKTPIVLLDRELQFAWGRILGFSRVYLRLRRCLFEPRLEASPKTAVERDLCPRSHKHSGERNRSVYSSGCANLPVLGAIRLGPRLSFGSRRPHSADLHRRTSSGATPRAEARSRHPQTEPDQAAFPAAFLTNPSGVRGMRLHLPPCPGWAV